MNILILTNPSMGPYGYSIVAKYVSKGLRDAGHDVWIVSTMPTGNIIKDQNGTPNIPTYFEVYGKFALDQYIKGMGADLVITIFDCWVQQAFEIPSIVHRHKIPLLAHVTTRSYPLPRGWDTFLSGVDHIVAPTWWGTEMVKEMFPNKVSYIQHGVDTKFFKPDQKARDKLRKRLGYEDKFVFLAVGRNKEMQKRYDIMFKAFKAFITNVKGMKNKVVLHVHTTPRESYDLETMRDMGFHDIGNDHIIFSSVRWNKKTEALELCRNDDPHAMVLNPHWGLDETRMCEMYNMADCFVHSGGGESFCLPVLESQACGLPSAVPDHSAFKEIVGKPETGILCKIESELTTPSLSDVKAVGTIDLAKGMYKIYSDKKLRETCKRNALENIKNYTWKEIVDKWIFVIEKMTEPKFNYRTGELGI